jgi:hypothetical protein
MCDHLPPRVSGEPNRFVTRTPLFPAASLRTQAAVFVKPSWSSIAGCHPGWASALGRADCGPLDLPVVTINELVDAVEEIAGVTLARR